MLKNIEPTLSKWD